MTQDFATARAALLDEIRAEAKATASYTGRASFAPAVLQALGRVPREQFLPKRLRDQAYVNRAMPLSQGQTISQPYIVALMTELLDIDAGSRVLEIGTGSGYQAAVLAEICQQVYTLETLPELAKTAKTRLHELGYTNIDVRQGNGRLGWPEAAPFDAIIVTAAGDTIPQGLTDQLVEGSRLVAPVNVDALRQELLRCVKQASGQLDCRAMLPVAFVPLTGQDAD